MRNLSFDELQYRENDLLQEVLRIYLKNPVPDFDVATTARKVNDSQRKIDLKEKTEVRGSNKTLTADFWFQQDDLLSSNIFQEYIPEYVQAKYGPFGKHFIDQFELRIEAPFLLGFKLAEYLEFKKNNSGFQDEGCIDLPLKSNMPIEASFRSLLQIT